MRRVVNRVAVVVFGVLAVVSPAVANTIVLREGLDGYSGTADVFVVRSSSGSSFTNLASGGRFVIDIWGSPFPPGYVTTKGGGTDWNQGLLKFDNLFDGIPWLIQVDSATLTLEIVNPYEKPSIWRLTTPWTEGTASWDLFDGDGNGTDVGDPPSLGGGVTPGVNTLATADFSSVATLTGTATLDMTAAVQAWYADPSSNHGWVFFKDDDGNRGMFVTSEDVVDITQRPALTVEFTIIPEPTTMTLLALGGIGLLRRRRRRR